MRNSILVRSIAAVSGIVMLASVAACGDNTASNTDSSASTDTKTTDTKGSPKTFDAGIALYVGMALTSAAGVAFVKTKMPPPYLTGKDFFCTLPPDLRCSINYI